MRVSTFLYTFVQGLKNIWSNKIFSFASIATMAACIFMFGVFYTIVVNFQSVVESVESSVTITVFFREDPPITQEEIDAIGRIIAARPEVASLEFVSAEQAWENFREHYFDGAESLLEAFGEENPLYNSAHYDVYMNDVALQSSLVTYVQSLDGVREVRRSELAADTITDFNRLIGYVSIGIILILLCVSVFLISNTVIVGISVRKEEIAIMKLIGATDYFVRGPFIVEGVLIGLIGSALPLVLLYFLYSRIIEYVGERFVFLSTLLEFLSVNQVFSTLVPVALVLGIGIGFAGSRITLYKHLRV